VLLPRGCSTGEIAMGSPAALKVGSLARKKWARRRGRSGLAGEAVGEPSSKGLRCGHWPLMAPLRQPVVASPCC
jgi:hypothetical protein